MQHDLTDAVAWAVEQGIAIEDKVCVYGGSYGGYACLAGLTFTPELYACGVDIWSVGAIIAELSTGNALFPGDSEIDELFKIFRLLGTPNEELWPGVSKLQDYKVTFPKWRPQPLASAMPAMEAAGVDLAGRMLCYTPAARITAKASLDHPYFADLDRSIIGTKALPEQPRAAVRSRNS